MLSPTIAGHVLLDWTWGADHIEIEVSVDGRLDVLVGTDGCSTSSRRRSTRTCISTGARDRDGYRCRLERSERTAGDPRQVGAAGANGLKNAAPVRFTSSTLRVTSVRSCSSAVAAISPSITGTGSGTERSAQR